MRHRLLRIFAVGVLLDFILHATLEKGCLGEGSPRLVFLPVCIGLLGICSANLSYIVCRIMCEPVS